MTEPIMMVEVTRTSPRAIIEVSRDIGPIPNDVTSIPLVEGVDALSSAIDRVAPEMLGTDMPTIPGNQAGASIRT